MLKTIQSKRAGRAVAVLVIGLISAACIGVVMDRRASAACAGPVTDYGTVTSSVQVQTAGSYRIWSRLMAPDVTNNSYLLEVDGDACYTVGDTGLAANQWEWVDYQDGNTSSKVSLNLTAGTHVFKLIGREPSVKVDRVMAVLDGTCTTGPSGTGDNCMADIDTVPPSVSITAPADGAVVSGTVGVAVTASDAKGVTKVDFYVDNGLVSTDTTVPYAYNWDTAASVNGNHTLMAKAYDAAGNIGTNASNVSVKNGDTVAPSMPANVRAAANAPNKVTVTWNASSDNVGVTGYSVMRDNQTIATGVVGTGYVDNSVAASTNYTYKVTAYDAAGNASAPSAGAFVTTPAPSTPDTTPPTTPASVTATTVSSSQINLSWPVSTDNVAVAGYDIYRSTPGVNPAKIASVTVNSYGDANLKPSTQYSYSVTARDGSGNSSAPSALATATTQAVTIPPGDDSTTGGTIRGKVTGRRNSPIKGARVVAVADGKRYIATTNSAGVYRFDNLPAGRYVLHYKASGYKPGDETLRLREGANMIWNMRLEKR